MPLRPVPARGTRPAVAMPMQCTSPAANKIQPDAYGNVACSQMTAHVHDLPSQASLPNDAYGLLYDDVQAAIRF